MFIFRYAYSTFVELSFMARTSMRVSEDTYKMVIKTRGLFEQLFKRKLSLDDTVYLSSRLVSFIYEMFQKLDAQNLIEIIEVADGTLRLEGVGRISEVLPDIIDEVTEINDKLAEKEKKTARLKVTAKR